MLLYNYESNLWITYRWVRIRERMKNHGSTKDDRVYVYLLRKEGAKEYAVRASSAGEVPAQTGQSATFMGGESDVLVCMDEK